MTLYDKTHFRVFKVGLKHYYAHPGQACNNPKIWASWKKLTRKGTTFLPKDYYAHPGPTRNDKKIEHVEKS